MINKKEKQNPKNENIKKSTVRDKKVMQKKTTKGHRNDKSIASKFIPKTESEILLTGAFLILLIVVIVLAVKVINLKQEANSKKDVDLVIPILDTKTNNTFSVDLSEMKSQAIKEYKFMVTNYKDDMIATKDINYNIELVNDNKDISIKLYKNKAEDNLLTDDTLLTHYIENNKLSKKKKSADTYYLIIRMKDEIKEKENIKIKITTAIN